MSAPLNQIVQALMPDAKIQPHSIPDTGIELLLINPDYPQHALPSEVALALMEQPLYWAFCWASGVVLAQYILKNPEIVKDKTVLDFGSGSGVVAIAAAKANAKHVVACDIDPNALLAIKENANFNDVKLTLIDDFNKIELSFDVLTAADVLYDRDNLHWLDEFNKKAKQVLLADSRIKNFQHARYEKIGEVESCTLPDLDESSEFRNVSLYCSKAQD